jgi:hypothetical protein
MGLFGNWEARDEVSDGGQAEFDRLMALRPDELR